MHGLFGEIEIAEQAHQRSQNSARFRPVKSLYGPAQLFGHTLRHPRHTSRETESTQLRVASSIHNSNGLTFSRLRTLLHENAK